MKKRLVQFLGLFCIGWITLSCMGDLGYTSAPDGGFSCRTLQVTSYPALTEVPENGDRAQVYLNGVWDFQPAIASTTTPPQSNWGKIRVPGDWRRENAQSVPGVLSRGTGDPWKGFNGETLAQAWYQKQVNIPSGWEGRRILLSLERVSTDASLYINNRPCGEVNWPYGAVDITSMVNPGAENNLSLLVRAIPDRDDKAVIMGPNEIYTTEAKLDSRGLIGEVRLLSIPQGALISDVFVQPSTRKQQIQVDVELTDVRQAGSVEITAKMLDEQGQVEREFTATKPVKAQSVQTLNLVWDWQNPRLWDVEQPNLYTLRLQVKGEGIEDTYDQSFGFREFWIEGKQFYLNGTEIRLRPIYHKDNWQGWAVGIPEAIDRMIEGYQWAGFNIAELWPWNHDERGRWHFRELLSERADLKGFPIIAPALDMTPLGWSKQWKKEEKRKDWEERMERELRRYRNHPSILFWATSPNFLGHGDDQNPRRVGIKNVVGTLGSRESDRRWQERRLMVEAAVEKIKHSDPTRPVMVHQGASVGDIYALNSYLNLMPLQEREEWLSHWSKQGEMPYLVVEFGTPIFTTMMRSRDGVAKAMHSEPWMTEFSAIYLGSKAYELETSAYRDKIRQQFIADQDYQNWHHQPELDFAPAFQELQQLFSRNTWRSWRTFGITGGMIPWQDGHGWEISEKGREWVTRDAFQKGDRGPYLESIPKYFGEYFQPDSYRIYPGGKAILDNNGATLAWIAGGDGAFTAKDHSYRVGEGLQKQIVLVNDDRQMQPFKLNWEVVVEGETVAKGDRAGTLDPATTRFFPVEVALSDTEMIRPNVSWPLQGEIRLKAEIGDRKNQQEDSFQFRIFEGLKPNHSQVALSLYDPVGKTTRILEQLGYDIVPWDGQQTARLVVIGREVLSQDYELPGDLADFVRQGGRVMICSQHPDWLRDRLGWRVAPHISRRVFPVHPNHRAIEGLDAEDLLDWRGNSTLIEAYPNTLQEAGKLSPKGYPWYGWHWGNQGGVSSAAIEKFHYGSWRPILEAEFDLAYTPLMELEYGQGRLIWNQLDWEDHVPLDAAATRLTEAILDYGVTEPLRPKVKNVVFLGSDRQAAQLDDLGLLYQRVDRFSPSADLVILGEGITVQEEALRDYLNRGGRLLVLPRKEGELLGVKVAQVKDFPGSLNVPQWPETQGLSASDLRSRSGYDTWLIQSGGEMAADGLLSRLQVGNGVALFCQIDPEWLLADSQTYLRFTRWRQTRAISEILANLGATFKSDETLFESIQPQKRFGFWTSPHPVYHSDYRMDFELGDDPYRYYRW
ncbi:sugar-binding domain-containing protein [Roseofilum capinflatum]|uniref:Glycoside hydrolase family 2 TIM barrel-domain containing protein n=1 Tax=Roseofilum capinflatum BLCC-M114 TaxID=3022440 RepID=A0ABT7B8I4_9CYAN|nr:sugar-binding domain-containing protein [Roseofilum capinflatum]MDJ1175486.1 glycoside hydrolase family 2 TIM barrel-domain containing protein [Roseofilum capinflatum BLCC-M114]